MYLPETYTQRIKEQLNGEYEAYRKSLEEPFYQGLRINDLKITKEQWAKISPIPLENIPWTTNGFYYKDFQPAKHPFYHAGLYYIQEPSAMAPAAVLPIEPGDKVLDLCAAPGGKSTQLAAKLQGTGLLVSNDISASRAIGLVKNIELFGVRNALVTSESPEKLAKRFEGYFDKILVDAPCSGEGMFRKEPSMVKNWEETGVEYYVGLQKEILPSAVKMLKLGGQMVYSTCTFSKEEDEEILIWLLKEYPELTLVNIDKVNGFRPGGEGVGEAARLWPHLLKGEGHFVALLEKKAVGAENKSRKMAMPLEPVPKAMLESYLEFENEVIRKPLDRECIRMMGEKLYYLPEGLLDLKGLRVLRSGWYLGDVVKGRFEPSQHFASGLKVDEVKRVVTLEIGSQEVIRYLKGESLQIPRDKGYHLICVDQFPLGWVKVSGGIMKNKYPASWRLQ